MSAYEGYTKRTDVSKDFPSPNLIDETYKMRNGEFITVQWSDSSTCFKAIGAFPPSVLATNNYRWSLHGDCFVESPSSWLRVVELDLMERQNKKASFVEVQEAISTAKDTTGTFDSILSVRVESGESEPPQAGTETLSVNDIYESARKILADTAGVQARLEYFLKWIEPFREKE